MSHKRKSHKINYYNITINNNYYNNNVEKAPQETEDTNNNKEIDNNNNNNQNKEISKSDTSDKNNPTTFCKNMMHLILFLCISFNIFILFTPLFIKHGITKVEIRKYLFFCIALDTIMLIDYFVAFRVFYYDYIYQIQTKGKSIPFLLQSTITVGASVAFSRFIDDILKLESITGVLYYCIFLCITFPIWLFFIELFFLLKDANTYRTISKDETKLKFKKYINKTILSNNKIEIGFIILFIIILIYLLYKFYFT